MKHLFYCLLLIVFTSCATQKNAEKYYQKHPEELAQKCAAAFPVKDSIGAVQIDSTSKAGNIDYSDSIILLASEAHLLQQSFEAALMDNTEAVQQPLRKEIIRLQQQITEVKNKAASLKQSYRPCQPDTVFTSKTVYRENTAKVSALQTQVIQLQSGLQTMQHKRNNWRDMALIEAAVLLALLIVAAIIFFFKI